MSMALPKMAPVKKMYKVGFVKEGEPKVTYLSYVWAMSAKEAEEIVLNQKRRGGGRIIKIKAGALR